MAIIISPPLILFRSHPYTVPSTRAKGVAIKMAITNERAPVNPNSIERVAPSRPEMIPSGRPKFSPQPECTIGTMARTSTPFQENLAMILEIWVGRSAPTNGARIRSSRRNAVMISLGSP